MLLLLQSPILLDTEKLLNLAGSADEQLFFFSDR